MAGGLLGWSLAALAVWRVTHLLWAEDGPGDVFVWLRQALGDGALGRMADCFNCLSLWVALPFAAGLANGWGQGLTGWLALSGAAILLERIGGGTSPLTIHEEPAVPRDRMKDMP